MNKITFLVVVTFFANVLYSQTFMRIAQGTGSTLSAGSTIDSITFTQTFNCGDVILYGGETYPTVQIGSQCWFAKNLNIGTMIHSNQNQSDNGMIEKYCYNNYAASCITYGGLYQLFEAEQYNAWSTKGICPIGWHIPTSSEFEILSTAVGGNSNALKAFGQGTGQGAGSSSNGFNALLAGYRGSDLEPNFSNIAEDAGFWSWGWSGYNEYLHLVFNDTSINIDLYDSHGGLSIRCLKN